MRIHVTQRVPSPLHQRFTIAVAALAAMCCVMAAYSPLLAQRVPTISDHEVEGLLRIYSRPLLRVSGLGSNRVAMRIVPIDSFNAFVLDGQNVYMHIGTLMAARTPNEVIGVIAHEIGHIDGAHIAKMQIMLKQAQTRLLLLRVLGIGAAIAGGGAGAIVAADQLIIRQFLRERRQHESAADQAGVTYLERTGQSGVGMLKTFQRLREQSGTNSSTNPYLLSHPLETTRIARLQRRVRASRFFNKQDSPYLKRRHNLMRAKLFGYCAPYRTKKHFKPGSIYSLYSKAISLNCSGNCNGRCVKANNSTLKSVDRLIAAGKKMDPAYPYFYEFKGQVLSKSGRSREAIPYFQRALRLIRANRKKYPGPLSIVEKSLGRAMLKSGNKKHLERGITLLERAVLRRGDATTYETLARAYYRRGQQGMADYSTARARQSQGRFADAVVFARRAQRTLEPGSPAWLKADDIIKFAPRRKRRTLFGR